MHCKLEVCHTTSVVVRTQRLAEAGELSSWSQLRRSTRRYLRRLRDDGQEWLSSMKLWRGDIHVIEGEKAVNGGG